MRLPTDNGGCLVGGDSELWQLATCPRDFATGENLELQHPPVLAPVLASMENSWDVPVERVMTVGRAQIFGVDTTPLLFEKRRRRYG
jgi:hypothetical protein